MGVGHGGLYICAVRAPTALMTRSELGKLVCRMASQGFSGVLQRLHTVTVVGSYRAGPHRPAALLGSKPRLPEAHPNTLHFSDPLSGSIQASLIQSSSCPVIETGHMNMPHITVKCINTCCETIANGVSPCRTRTPRTQSFRPFRCSTFNVQQS